MSPAREERDSGLRRKALILTSALAVVALLVGSLFGDRGILHLLEQRGRADVLRRELDDLRAQNTQLAAEIVALRHDARAVERIAREELGLAREGEVLFLIRDEGAPADHR